MKSGIENRQSRDKLGIWKCSVIILILLCLLIPGSVRADDKTIILATLEWPPYCGQKLPGNGFLAEAAVKALESMGYSVKIQFAPWARVVKMMQTGLADGVIGIARTRQRQAYIAYPDYAWRESLLLFTLPGGKLEYSGLRDLCPARVGLLRAAYFTKQLEKITCLGIVPVGNEGENLDLLLRGEVGYVVAYPLSLQYVLRERDLAMGREVLALHPEISSNLVYVGFGRQRPGFEQLVEDYNLGMAELMGRGGLGCEVNRINAQVVRAFDTGMAELTESGELLALWARRGIFLDHWVALEKGDH